MTRALGVLAGCLVLGLGSGDAVGADLSTCKISVHTVDEARNSSLEPLIRPDQVSSAELMDSDPPEQHWFVTLTSDGGDRMLVYTTLNTGRDLAFHCDGRYVSRSRILVPFSRRFIVVVSPE